MMDSRRLGDLKNPPRAASVGTSKSSSRVSSREASPHVNPSRPNSSRTAPTGNEKRVVGSLSRAKTPLSTSSARSSRATSPVVEPIDRDDDDSYDDYSSQQQNIHNSSGDSKKKTMGAAKTYEYSPAPTLSNAQGRATAAEPYGTPELVEAAPSRSSKDLDVLVLEQLVVTMEGEKANLERKVKSMTRLHESQLQAEKVKLSSLQSQYEELNRYATEILEQRNQDAETEVNNLKRDLTSSREDFQVLATSHKQISAQNTLLQNQVKLLEEKEVKLRTALESSTPVFEEIKQECRQTARLCDELKHQKEELHKENSKLVSQFEKMAIDVREAQTRCADYHLLEEGNLVDREKSKRMVLALEHDAFVSQLALHFYKVELRVMVSRDLQNLKRELKTTRELSGSRIHTEVSAVEQKLKGELSRRQGDYEEQLKKIANTATTAGIERDLFKDECTSWKEQASSYRRAIEQQLPSFLEGLSQEVYRLKESIIQDGQQALSALNIEKRDNSCMTDPLPPVEPDVIEVALSPQQRGSNSSPVPEEDGAAAEPTPKHGQSNNENGEPSSNSGAPPAKNINESSSSSNNNNRRQQSEPRSAKLVPRTGDDEQQRHQQASNKLEYVPSAAAKGEGIFSDTVVEKDILLLELVEVAKQSLRLEQAKNEQLNSVITQLQQAALTRAHESNKTVEEMRASLAGVSERNCELERDRAAILRENTALSLSMREMQGLHEHHQESLSSLNNQFFEMEEEKKRVESDFLALSEKMEEIMAQEKRTREETEESTSLVDQKLQRSAGEISSLESFLKEREASLQKLSGDYHQCQIKGLEGNEKFNRQKIVHEFELYFARREVRMRTAAAM